MISFIITVLLLVPPVVLAAFWRASVAHRMRRRRGKLPDPESVVLARLGGLACTLLPIVQMFAGVERWKSGEVGTYLWFILPAFGVLLALAAMTTFLKHARGSERIVATSMVLVATSMLLLVTFVSLSPDL